MVSSIFITINILNICIAKKIIKFTSIVFITIIYVFSNKFLCVHQIWNFLFFMISGLVDIINLIGQIKIYKYLKKQGHIVQNIQYHLQNQINLTLRLKACSYQSYLSRYQIILIYKYENTPTSFTYTIARYSHAMCLLVIGILTLKNQILDCSSFLKKIVIVFIMLSIYISTYQIDQTLFQTSKGKYQRIQGLRSSVYRQIIQKILKWRINCIYYIIDCDHIFKVYYSIQELLVLFVSCIMTAVFLFWNACLQIYFILRVS